MKMDFTVLMSVYRNDKPEYLRTAVESVTVKQTVQPSEMLLMVDGPVGEELTQTINELEREIPYLRPLWQPVNQGLGRVLRLGVEMASNEIIARMDSDDIAMPDRFEKELAMFERDVELSMVGSCISEFIDEPSHVVSHRNVPSTDVEIKKYMRSRCPFNHMTVMFKKSEVLKSGNYEHWFWNEDYYLWIRMMMAGCKFANLNEVLVNVRVGRDMYQRRGGMKYYRSEKKLQKYMLENQVITGGGGVFCQCN